MNPNPIFNLKRNGIIITACYITVESHKFEVLRTGGLFRIISSSNYREVDIEVFKPTIDYSIFPIKHFYWVRKRNFFFYESKTCL